MAKCILSVAFQSLFIKPGVAASPSINEPIKPIHPVGIVDHRKGSFEDFFPVLRETN